MASYFLGIHSQLGTDKAIISSNILRGDTKGRLYEDST